MSACAKCGYAVRGRNKINCQRCRLHDGLIDIFGGSIPVRYTILVENLMRNKRPLTTLNWIKRPRMQAFLSEMLTTDTIPVSVSVAPDGVAKMIRLLYMTGAFTREEVMFFRAKQKCDALLQAATSRISALSCLALESYVRWHELPQLAGTPALHRDRSSTLTSRVQLVTKAIRVSMDFLAYLEINELSLASITSPELLNYSLKITNWELTCLNRFLRWAAETETLKAKRPRIKTFTRRYPTMGDGIWRQQFEKLLNYETLPLKTTRSLEGVRLAMLLCHLGVQLRDVRSLRLTDVVISDNDVTFFKFGTGSLAVRVLTPLVRRVLEKIAEDVCETYQSEWLFPGLAGRPLSEPQFNFRARQFGIRLDEARRWYIHSSLEEGTNLVSLAGKRLSQTEIATRVRLDYDAS